MVSKRAKVGPPVGVLIGLLEFRTRVQQWRDTLDANGNGLCPSSKLPMAMETFSALDDLISTTDHAISVARIAGWNRYNVQH